MVYYHRTHPCPLETCGCVASMDKVNGKLTVWGTFQARTSCAPSPRFCQGSRSATSASSRPTSAAASATRWASTGLRLRHRRHHRHRQAGEVDRGPDGQPDGHRLRPRLLDEGPDQRTKEGKITGLHCHVTADHGAFDACADPTKFPAGFFHICTGSYDIPVAYVGVDGVYTNKAPGGVAYRCSFRVTEAAYFIERMIEVLAIELNMDAAELRRINFIRKDSSPTSPHSAGSMTRATTTPPGTRRWRRWTTRACAPNRRSASPTSRRARRGNFWASDSRTSPKSSAPAGQELRHPWHGHVRQLRNPHPPHRFGHRAAGHHQPGPGPRHTFAQIIASEIGLSADSITVEEGDTDTAPYGLGTYGSRSTPVAGAAPRSAAARSAPRRR